METCVGALTYLQCFFFQMQGSWKKCVSYCKQYLLSLEVGQTNETEREQFFVEYRNITQQGLGDVFVEWYLGTQFDGDLRNNRYAVEVQNSLHMISSHFWTYFKTCITEKKDIPDQELLVRFTQLQFYLGNIEQHLVSLLSIQNDSRKRYIYR